MSLALAACTAPIDAGPDLSLPYAAAAPASDLVIAPDIVWIDRPAIDSLPEGHGILVDLRRASTGMVWDRTRGELDLARVWMICPNGARMPADVWVDHLEAGTTDLATRAYAGISAHVDLAGGAVLPPSPCVEVCHTCPDGLTVCTNACDDPDAGRTDRGGDGPDDVRWTDRFGRTEDRTPDPPSSDDGSGGAERDSGDPAPGGPR